MKSLLLCTFNITIHIFIMTVVFCMADDENIWAVQSDEKNRNEKRIDEKYIYEAIPVVKRSVEEKEIIRMEIVSTGNGFSLTSETIGKNRLEVIRILTDKYGNFVSGTKETLRQSAEQTHREVIRRYDEKIYVESISKAGEKIKGYKIPDSMRMAVDMSLLVLLRSFPFNTNEPWEVYMVDFSQNHISVTIKQAGEEHVIVPAGGFECYRIEVTINLPVVKPMIIFWLAKKDPHFLVKHSGMKGPFTLPSITTLVSIE